MADVFDKSPSSKHQTRRRFIAKSLFILVYRHQKHKISEVTDVTTNLADNSSKIAREKENCFAK